MWVSLIQSVEGGQSKDKASWRKNFKAAARKPCPSFHPAMLWIQTQKTATTRQISSLLSCLVDFKFVNPTTTQANFKK